MNQFLKENERFKMKNTERLIQLLQQREEMIELPSKRRSVSPWKYIQSSAMNSGQQN